MKFGLFGGALAASTGGASADSNGYQTYIDYVVEADTLGYHSVFVVEHHFTGIGQVSSTMNLLTYLAAKTKRIRLGSGVMVLPWHNPVLLAEQIATLDLLSGGRADIGVGKGYRPYEFKGFNIPPEEAAERYEEGLELMLKSWTAKERFSHQGKYWGFTDIIVEPAPTQLPHPPIWVGAASTASIQRTAEKNFNLLLDHLSSPEDIQVRMAVYQDALKEHGHAYTPCRVGVTRAIQVTNTNAERDAIIQKRASLLQDVNVLKSGAVGPGMAFSGEADQARIAEMAWKIAESSAVVGKVDEVISKLKALEASGVEYVLLTDATASKEALRTFAREVMPEFH